MKKIRMTLCLLLISSMLIAQNEIPDLTGVQKVIVKNYWGDQYIKGVDKNNNAFGLIAHFTGNSKKYRVTDSQLKEYVSVYKEKKTLYVLARIPKGFESIDLTLSIPSDLLVLSELHKGGNIYMENLENGVEVNSLNGSVNLKGIADYALVSAANGEVAVQFESVDPAKAISLITMNGGVSVTLPKETARDVRLISRKNGYVISQFDLEGELPVRNLNMIAYSKVPIIESTTINGGGSLLFLSTQNGPIAIKKGN